MGLVPGALYCRSATPHGHRDEDTVQSVPTRRGAFAGWDAQGGELPYRRLHGDELAGDVVRPRPWRAWGGTELGGLSASQGGAGTAMLRRCLQVVAARPCSIGQTGWPDRGLRLRLRMGMKVVMWARVRTHTHTHTHTRMGYWGGCWIGSRKVGRGCGRRSGMGSGFVFARRSTRCVRGLPRGSLSIYLSIPLQVHAASGFGRCSLARANL